MQTEDVIAKLKKLIAEELDVNLKEDELDENLPFFEGGLGIDSIAIVELISLVEDNFNIQFTDSDLVPDSFSSLKKLAEVIAAKINA